MTIAIEIDHLTRFYGKNIGVENLCLNVPKGELFGFLGPNGAGKTTTIRILMGFIKATSGSIRVDGNDCWKDSAKIKHNLGFLPDEMRFYPWMTPRRALKVSSSVRQKNLLPQGLKLMERFELKPDLKISQMSRGNKQKVGLVLSMAHQPDLLILDEPTTALDPLVQETLFQILEEYAQQGRTVFFSSHTLSEVERLCNEVAILKNGKLVLNSSLTELRKRVKRQITITWPETLMEIPETPSCLSLESNNKRQWKGILQGELSELMAWTAKQPIEDITIEKPSLTDLFQQFYTDETHV